VASIPPLAAERAGFQVPVFRSGSCEIIGEMSESVERIVAESRIRSRYPQRADHMRMIEYLVTPPIVDDAECATSMKINELCSLGPTGDREMAPRALSRLDLPSNKASQPENPAKDLVPCFHYRFRSHIYRLPQYCSRPMVGCALALPATGR
jgi:hypothetical protein